VVDKDPLSGQLAQRYVPSIQRARNELGLDVKINLSEAIRRTVKYYADKV
jgi:nucleoside-diphosphate-sugar epimerase